MNKAAMFARKCGVFALVVAFALGPATSAVADGVSPYGTEPRTKVDICHSTPTAYDNGIKEVSVSAVFSTHANDNTGGVDGNGDIIPPFYYEAGHGQDTTIEFYAGKNWYSETIAIWNNDCDVPTPVASIDLSVTKVVDDATPDEGQTVTYTITVSNAGPDDATDVVVTDTLPVGTTFVSASNGGSGSPVTWNLGDLQSGASVELTVTVTIDSETGGDTIVNTAVVSGVENDTDSTDNSDSESVTVNIPSIPGCTDPQASNFDPEATEDDGSCEYPPAPGTITIVKQVLGDVAEWAFDFVGFGGFSLDTANSSQAFEDLEIGEYSVSETVPEGWAVPDIQCVDTNENQVGQVVDSGVSLTLGEDQGITCTFTNRQEMGTLHVVKDIAGETNATPDMFQFTVNDGAPVTFEADGQNDLVLLAGTYTVEEVTAQGFTTSYEGCDEIVIEDGGEATCTITNRVLDGGGEDELSCSLTSSDTSVRRGREVVLSWDVQNATDVAIDSGVGEDLPANGSSAVTVNADTTYVLTASNSETEETIQCSVSVDTRSGGGGGSRRAPSGEVAGDSDESPVPEVAGVQTAVLPVGAPNTGMGGASGNAAAASMLGSFLLMIGGIVATRFTKGA